MMYDHFVASGKYFNLSMPRTSEFYDEGYYLKRVFLSNAVNNTVHLNSYGLAVLVSLIKRDMFGPKRGGPKRTDGRPWNTVVKEGVQDPT